jgi:hypothetical protein
VARAYLASSRALAGLLVVVGIAMVVASVAGGAGPFALGVILGVLFAALGAARLRLAQAQEAIGAGDRSGGQGSR